MVLLIEQPAIRVSERSYAIEVLLGEFLGLPIMTIIHESHDVRISAIGDNQCELWLPDTFFQAADGHWLEPELTACAASWVPRGANW